MRVLAATLLILLCAGCESVAYYGQAIGGHLKLMAAARPVDAWIDDVHSTRPNRTQPL